MVLYIFNTTVLYKSLKLPLIHLFFASKEPDISVFRVFLSNSPLDFLKVFQSLSLDIGCFFTDF